MLLQMPTNMVRAVKTWVYFHFLLFIQTGPQGQKASWQLSGQGIVMEPASAGLGGPLEPRPPPHSHSGVTAQHLLCPYWCILRNFHHSPLPCCKRTRPTLRVSSLLQLDRPQVLVGQLPLCSQVRFPLPESLSPTCLSLLVSPQPSYKQGLCLVCRQSPKYVIQAQGANSTASRTKHKFP